MEMVGWPEIIVKGSGRGQRQQRAKKKGGERAEPTRRLVAVGVTMLAT
jgi:hypothetical protein